MPLQETFRSSQDSTGQCCDCWRLVAEWHLQWSLQNVYNICRGSQDSHHRLGLATWSTHKLELLRAPWTGLRISLLSFCNSGVLELHLDTWTGALLTENIWECPGPKTKMNNLFAWPTIHAVQTTLLLDSEIICSGCFVANNRNLRETVTKYLNYQLVSNSRSLSVIYSVLWKLQL